VSFGTQIHLNKAHFPVTTLGFGRRVGIWTQGCSIRCKGCVSRDTWEIDKNKAIEVAVFAQSVQPWLRSCDGVTISGGEPLDQPQALLALIPHLRKHCPGDILIFSGYPQELIFRRFSQITSKIDVLISDPYAEKAGATLHLRGSDNQRVSLLSPLARLRYAGIETELRSSVPKMDVIVDGDNVWMAGIPRPLDLARLRGLLEVKGLHSYTSDQPPVVRA
jgi:anaerobic ribonucleoside-triphosphate reductase activating protein